MDVKRKRLLIVGLTALLTLAADQVSKQTARRQLRGRAAVEIIDDYLALEYHENPGIAFSIGRNWPGRRYIFTGVGLVALFFVWRLLQQLEGNARVGEIAFGLIAGGAIGNLIDRVILGKVIDFIVMHWHRKYQWPAYNVADAALVVGVGLLVAVMGRKPKQQPSKRKKRKS